MKYLAQLFVIMLFVLLGEGLAIGNASHAAGTAKAMEMGPVDGVMSSLAIVLSGIFTVPVAPLAIGMFFRDVIYRQFVPGHRRIFL